MASSQDSHFKTFFVTQYHAQKSFRQDEEINRNHRSIFPWFPIRGLKLFSIGWLASKEHLPENRGRLVVFSASGDYIAVLFKNEITILRKHDNFTKAFQTFTALPESKAFLHAVWMDPWNILAVSDNFDTIYFLQSNEEELKIISKCHLQGAGTIVGLFVWEDRRENISDRYSIMVITSDCILQWIVLNVENSAVNPLNSEASQQSILGRQHPLGISCSCFHKELSFLVLAGPTNEGLYCLSVWHLTNTSDIELICSNSEFKGVLTFPKRHSGPFSAPKVVISSCGRHLGMLDLTGSLHILTLEGNPRSVCEISLSDKNCMEISDEGRNTVSLDGIIDFTWWSKGKLMVAKSNGMVNLIGIPSANNLLEDSPRFSSPVLVRNPSSDGHVFVLEIIFPYQSEESSGSLHQVSSENVQHGTKMSDSTFEFKNRVSGWKLLSLLEQSVPEMYRFLIDGQKYEAAHHFALKHGFDEDEVLKSQWLHSDYGKEAVQNVLSSIHDRSWVLSECLDKIGSIVDSVHAILSYGLSETENYRFQEIKIADYNIVFQFLVRRLRLLQYSDRLETFLGVNMGRFSSQEYAVFRRRPLGEIAINLAESGKFGALNLLFKRHTFSLAPSILRILDAVPETVSVHSYSQLLPGLFPPKFAQTGRDQDWVENQELMAFIESHWRDNSEEIDLRMCTEHMVKLHSGLLWPSATEIIEWYKERARTIDKLSGQLENCLSLLDIGYRKGVVELRAFFEDVSDLCHLIFPGGDIEDRELDLRLTTWEHLSDDEKFKAMLNGVTEATVVERLRELAIPFMHRKYGTKQTSGEGNFSRIQPVKPTDCSETFLVKWLKEKAEDNHLELCSVILKEGCKENWLFKDEVEMIEVGLYCIYACTLTDRWDLMASILSKLPRKNLSRYLLGGRENFIHRKGLSRGLERVPRNSHSSVPSNAKVNMSPMFLDEEDSSPSSVSRSHDVFDSQEKEDAILENLDTRLRLAEGHVEAGRLFTHYQVPKPIVYFLKAHEDQREVKQLIRLVLSKFGRRLPERSDNEWATMWRDMQLFQEKAFPFLDSEYMLLEFCRGLLKAGKFSLARNYLKGTASMGLALEKAEILVIEAAREYFFAASSLDSSEIWKAKECLALFPSSKQVKAEADVIDAITIKLPRLGVTLLPMQFRQITNPMEIVKMVIMSKTGSYLKAGELIEVSRLLGLNFPDDIAKVEEAIAREAGATGDLQLAVDFCVRLARKDHGPVWDLCAALGRGPDLDKLDLQSRKELLGFALSHCDVESVGELLHAWKEIDLASQCENLGNALGKKVPTLSDQKALIALFPIKSREEIMALIESNGGNRSDTLQEGQDEKTVFKILSVALASVTKKFSRDQGFDWDVLSKESKRFMSFAALQLPWLIELSRKTSADPNSLQDSGLPFFTRECSIIHARATSVILYWLASNNTLPDDSLIVNFAKTAMEKPVSQENDMLGCSYLLNLSDPHLGVEVVDDAVRKREEYQEVRSAIKIGQIYSSLQACVSEHLSPKQRRKLLLNKFCESQSTDSVEDK